MTGHPYTQIEPCNKSNWPDGPWKNEPDLLEWIDPETNYNCSIIRVFHSGHLCGYVEIPKNLKLSGLSYDSKVSIPKGWMERKIDIDKDVGIMNLFCAPILINEKTAALCLLLFCHGGLTYSQNNWLGFDCSHAGDLRPVDTIIDNIIKYPHHKNDIYRDFTYVKSNVTRLAKQIWEYQNIAEFN